MASFRDRFKAAVKVLTGDAILQGILPWASPPSRDTKGLLNSYNTNPWERNAVSKTANAVADAVWYVAAIYDTAEARRTQKGAKRYPQTQSAGFEARRKLMSRYKAEQRLRYIDNHPLLTMLTDGNALMDGGTCLKLTQVYINIKGEAFWLLERNRFGMPVAFWPLPLHWVLDTPVADRPTFRVQFPHTTLEVPEYDMVWFKEPNPVDPYGRGTGRGEALGDELDADEFAAHHVKSWFYNRAIPPVVVVMEGQKENQLKEIQTEWENKNRGLFNQFRTHFLNRKAEIKELGQSFQDQQMVPLREFIRNTIVQMNDVPPEIAGILDSSNKATIQAAEYIMQKHAVVPRLEFLRRIMQKQLVPDFDERLILDYENPVPGDKEFELSVVKAFPHIETVDELRELVGKEPVGGEEGATRIRMVNTVPYKLGESLSDITEQMQFNKVEPTPPPQEKKAALSDITSLVDGVSVTHLSDAFGHTLPDVVKFNDATRSELLHELVAGLNRDESLPQLVKRVTNVFSDAKGKRATDAAKAEAERAKVDERRLLANVKKALQKQESELIRALNALYEE